MRLPPWRGLLLTLLAVRISAAADVGKGFHAELDAPSAVQAGVPAQLTFAIKDSLGRNTAALRLVHERLMHVMIVSSDLADFEHVHPALSEGDVFRISHVFPHGGDYRVFSEFAPVAGGDYVESFSVKVEGAQRAAVQLGASASSSRTLGSVRMTLASEKPFRTGQDIGIYMTLADARTGSPVHDLQRYLGSWAHIAIISEDTQEFLHVHPEEDPPSNFEFFWYMAKRDLLHINAGEPGADSPATLRTFAGFRRPGLYKMWVEVQRSNVVLTFPFVLRVTGEAGHQTRGPQVPSGATLIKVTSAGYEPSRIDARAGRPLRLAFFRGDAANCGRIVAFPDLGIERELTPGQTALIEITPRKSGPLAFSCGMNMMRGEILVQ